MNFRKKLFFHRNPYDLSNTRHLFFNAVKQNVKFHTENCSEYSTLLKSSGFEISQLKSEADIYKIPPVPSLYFKRNLLLSVPEDKLTLKATSSGTKGSHSVIGFDRQSLYYGIIMMLRFFSYHKVISLKPTNYIVLGYEPSSHIDIGAAKTAYGTTKFAPALHREYALKDTGSSYEINIDGIKKAILCYAKQPFPVRFVGFPSYMHFLAKTLKKNGIKLNLSKSSKILLGGGWKQFSNEQIDRDEFCSLIKETLGIDKHNVLEFFSAVEHPLPYLKCSNGHFHVPIYSRVIIRDANTLEPVPDGVPGILSFVSPLMRSVPLVSVMTDDIAVAHPHESCGCGITTPYFELLGRAGVQQIKTCTTDSAELMKGITK